MQKSHRAFFIVTIAVFLLFILSEVFQEGLHMDGLIYGTLGNNLANGKGSFWEPSFSATIVSSFHGHPPLAFGLQQIFFKLFGSAFYIEKIYSALTGVATGWFIIKIWKHVFDKHALQDFFWLPVLLWITMPEAFWSYNNNALENTMGLFSLIAVFYLLVSLKKTGAVQITYIVFSAFLLILSFLSKGFPGLFPLGFFGLYYLVKKDDLTISKAVIKSFFLLIGVGLFAVGLYLYQPSKISLEKYFDIQVISSLNGERYVISRTYILLVILMNTGFVLGLLGLLALIKRKVIHAIIGQNKASVRMGLLFILIALSASLPIMISPKQLSFYIVPALPYFALGFSVLIALFLQEAFEKLSLNNMATQGVQYMGFALIAASIYIGVANFGTFNRQETLIKSVYKMGEHIPSNTIVGCSSQLTQDWSLMGYLQRKFFISLELNGEHEYFLIKKNDQVPDNYQVVDDNLDPYILLKRS